MEHNMKKINIMGVRIDNVTMDEVMGTIEDKISKSEQYVIYTPNTEFIMMCREDDEFKDYMNSSDINIPDGIGLIYAAKIKNHPLKEKVAGFDLSLKMLELADRKGFKLFAIGGKPGVAQSAMEKVHEKYPGIKIAGTCHGYFKGAHLGQGGHEEELKVLDEINKAEPDILFVGFGAKKQEQWIQFNKDKINAKIIIGNGGTLDGLAGNVKRAPEIFIKLGLEWFYRLLQEPQRISRQKVLPIFMLNVIFGNKNIVKEIE
jgi:N-acetylglucosaminyldiphosphoundecaprenol N-acetyl-beta-D-mannosaminyltransferase